MKLHNRDGTILEYLLGLVLTTIPENSATLDPGSKFEQVSTAPTAVALQVFKVGNIVGYVHVLREIASSSKTDDGRNERCIVNCHIDPASWSDSYN
jgi:hypothetical protein